MIKPVCQYFYIFLQMIYESIASKASLGEGGEGEGAFFPGRVLRWSSREISQLGLRKHWQEG